MSIFEAELFTRILLGYTSHQDIGKTWEKSALDEMKRDHYSGFSSCFFFQSRRNGHSYMPCHILAFIWIQMEFESLCSALCNFFHLFKTASLVF